MRRQGAGKGSHVPMHLQALFLPFTKRSSLLCYARAISLLSMLLCLLAMNLPCRAEEVIVPVKLFKQHGCEVTVASIKGGEIPMDEASLNPPYLTKVVEEALLDGKFVR